MALILSDRVQEVTTSPGTGDVTLGGAVTGFRTFASVMANADTCYYTIADQGGANWEVGLGTYASSGNLLQRTTVYASSAGGTTKANFASGNQAVFITYPAGRSVNLDGTGNVSALGTVSSGTWQGSTIGVLYGGTGTTTSTGTGSVVLSTSPTLTTPNLGTPSAITLSNATGLPLTTGVTGVLPTANGGTNLSSFNANGAVYATSSSALTTGTLPVVSGGTGTTTSTGTGSVVLNTSPTLVTPNIGAATGTSLVVSSGLVSSGGFGGTLTTGIAADYDGPATNGRISVSGSSNLTFYTGGLGTTPTLRLYANGSIGVGSTPSPGSSGQVLTSNGSGSAPSWQAVTGSPEIKTPTNVSPANSATNIGETPTLTGSTYYSLYGIAMAAGQWQVSTVSNFATTVVSTGDVAGTSVSYAVGSGILSVNTLYYWRVRYKDANGTYSDWSTATSFTTATAFAPTVIGQAFGGGFYAGQISTTGNGVATHYLIVAPKSSGENSSRQWKTTNTSTSGTSSVIDGPTNSANMNNASHPAAQFCEGLTIGGFSDWYMPAKNELEVCYYNLKPTTTANNTSSGTNTNAVPSRGSNYTSGTPAQTTASAFQSGGAEAFAAGTYWSSTEFAATNAWGQVFGDGFQLSGVSKDLSIYVRAVRRVPI